jgi:replication-associated recombination protein RarA
VRERSAQSERRTRKLLKRIDQLIGPAREIATTLLCKVQRVKAGEDENDPILLWGDAGVAKSTVAYMLGLAWAGGEFSFRHYNGQEMTVELVRDWRNKMHFRPLSGLGDCSVILVDEIDAGSKAALGELRMFLDTMPDWCGFIATTNKQPVQLDESIQTRFYDREMLGASGREIQAWLMAQGAPPTTAQKIVQACGGNVRQARLEWKKIADYRQIKRAA